VTYIHTQPDVFVHDFQEEGVLMHKRDLHTLKNDLKTIKRDQYTYTIRRARAWHSAERGSDTGRRRHIGCLKLQVIFRKRATNYWALLREMTCKDPDTH